MTWCQECKNEWQRAYRAGERKLKAIPKPEKRGDCLIWQGYVNPVSGYGQVSTGVGKTGYAHRVAWERVHGVIPDGLTVDHLCEQKLCVNVEHMELCSRGENARRYYERRVG